MTTIHRWRRPRSLAIAAFLTAAGLLAACASPQAQTPAKPAATQAPAAQPTTAAAKPAATGAEAPKPAAPPAASKSDTSFYTGKTVRFIVGYAPGGGFDSYARLIARYLGEHIPGKPTVVVENMPGAGSTVAANHLYKVAEKDGTVIATFNELQLLNQLVGREGIEFDLRKFSWIGSAYSGQMACAVRKDTGVTSLKDLVEGNKELVFGGTAPGAETDDFPRVLREVLGAKIKLVSGYEGTAKIRLAVESREADGACWSWQSMRATAGEWFTTDFAQLITWQGTRPHPDFQNLLKAEDLAKTDEQRAMLRAIAAPGAIAKPYAAPPGVPADRLELLRKGFADTFADPRFIADAEKGKLDIDFTKAPELEKIVNEILNTSPDTAKKLGEVLK